MRPRPATPPRATRPPLTPRRGGLARPARARTRVASGLAAVASGLARIAAVLALAATSLALAAPAGATTITEGTLARPFTFTPLPETLELIDGADQALRLRTTATLLLGPDSPLMQAYPGPDATADPRSVQVLPDGHLLVTDRERQIVAEITAGGALVWTYTHEDDAAFVRPFSARRFVAGGRELTLIADRWAARVFAVDQDKRLVWQYGKTDQPGLGVDQLADPFFAAYRDGRVLIADNNGGNRVIEIRYDDYVEGAPDHGFTAASIVWQYGVAGEYGSAPGLLMKPRSPQRLDNGNVLICDADGQRVIEVRASDYDADAPDLGYTADSIVWQFGVTAEPGSDDLHLSDPTYAERLSTGATLIADTNNGRVLEVSRRGAILRRWDLRTIGRPGTATATDTAEPRAATLGLGGSLVTADTAFGQVLDIGVAARAAAASVLLDGGRPGTAKRWTRIALEAGLPSTTALVLDYSLDGQTWRTAPFSDDLVAALPVTTVGAALAYRVTLRDRHAAHHPCRRRRHPRVPGRDRRRRRGHLDADDGDRRAVRPRRHGRGRHGDRQRDGVDRHGDGERLGDGRRSRRQRHGHRGRDRRQRGRRGARGGDRRRRRRDRGERLSHGGGGCGLDGGGECGKRRGRRRGAVLAAACRARARRRGRRPRRAPRRARAPAARHTRPRRGERQPRRRGHGLARARGLAP